MSQIKSVAVFGAGTMGAGIAQVCAHHGYDVNLYDVSKEILERSLGGIAKSLEKFVKSGAIDAKKKEQSLNRIKIFTNLTDDIGSVDIVIEALTENIDVKTGSYKTVDKHLKSGTIICSNTSSIPITALAASTTRKDQFIGAHFMNPVPLMKGVEVIKGRETSEDTLQKVKSFLESIDKIPSVAVDYAGFITTRIFNSYLNEAALAVMIGNDPEEIDKAMVTCVNMPMGPCKIMDLVGIDVLVSVMKTLEDEFGERFKVAPILKQMARAGHFGVKTGKGFYNYKK